MNYSMGYQDALANLEKNPVITLDQFIELGNRAVECWATNKYHYGYFEAVQREITLAHVLVQYRNSYLSSSEAIKACCPQLF